MKILTGFINHDKAENAGKRSSRPPPRRQHISQWYWKEVNDRSIREAHRIRRQ